MNVTVLLFARLREVAGAGRMQVEVAEGSSASDVFGRVITQAPGLAGMRANLRCAIDEEYATWDQPLHDGAELAFIPPTAGG